MDKKVNITNDCESQEEIFDYTVSEWLMESLIETLENREKKTVMNKDYDGFICETVDGKRITVKIEVEDIC